MSTVVLLAGYTPGRESLGRVIAKLQAEGAQVVLAGMTDVEATHADLGADSVRSLRRHVESDPEFFRTCRTVSAPVETWMHVERDDELIARCREADVVVALDTAAVYSAWRISRLNTSADVRHGAMPGYEALLARKAAPDAGRQGRDDTGRPGRARARAAVARRARATAASSAVLSRPVRPVWTRFVASRRLSPGRRAALAAPAVTSLYASGETEQARALADAVLATLPVRHRANLLGTVAERLIDRGITPPMLRDAVAAELDYADKLHRAGDAEGAAASVLQAVRLGFHRAVHLDTTTSPLAENPREFTAPLRSSAAVAAVSRRRGRQLPAAPPPAGRPARIIVATHGNTNFVGQLSDHLVEHPDAEIRELDLATVGKAATLPRDPRRMLAALLADEGPAFALAEKSLREHLDWADVVFIDWVTPLVRLLTMVDPGTTRIVVRLHSYEAFTPWPHLLDLSRIDDFIFVSDHLKDLTIAQVPALEAPGGPRVHVVPNAMDLKRFVRPKADDARFTVGLIGYQVVAKDPRWALAVLRELRAHDPRYRLRLVGHPFDRRLSAAADAYGEAFERELEALRAEGAIEDYGFTTDLPEAAVGIGSILCSSVREGSPVALIEAAASGAVPVVRDWPFFAATEHGPRTLYPSEWVVETPAEAAARILAATKDLPSWRATSAAVSAEVVARWDIAATGDAYEALLLG